VPRGSSWLSFPAIVTVPALVACFELPVASTLSHEHPAVASINPMTSLTFMSMVSGALGSVNGSGLRTISRFAGRKNGPMGQTIRGPQLPSIQGPWLTSPSTLATRTFWTVFRGMEVDMPGELDVVVLTRDVPEHALIEGDIGTVVHRSGDGSFFEVEFVTGDGRTVVVLTLGASDLRAMAAGEIVHARRLARLGRSDPDASAPSRRRM
jgi:hypothetical protein